MNLEFYIHNSVVGKPDPPYNIRFVNATHNSVTIAWTRGFDGGLPQTFRVRYKPTGDEGYTYVDVKPNNITVYTVTGKLT